MVGEVEFEFEKRGEVEQFVAQRGQFFAELPAHLLECHSVGGGRG